MLESLQVQEKQWHQHRKPSDWNIKHISAVFSVNAFEFLMRSMLSIFNTTLIGLKEKHWRKTNRNQIWMACSGFGWIKFAVDEIAGFKAMCTQKNNNSIRSPEKRTVPILLKENYLTFIKILWKNSIKFEFVLRFIDLSLCLNGILNVFLKTILLKIVIEWKNDWFEQQTESNINCDIGWESSPFIYLKIRSSLNLLRFVIQSQLFSHSFEHSSFSSLFLV